MSISSIDPPHSEARGALTGSTLTLSTLTAAGFIVSSGEVASGRAVGSRCLSPAMLHGALEAVVELILARAPFVHFEIMKLAARRSVPGAVPRARAALGLAVRMASVQFILKLFRYFRSSPTPCAMSYSGYECVRAAPCDGAAISDQKLATISYKPKCSKDDSGWAP